MVSSSSPPRESPEDNLPQSKTSLFAAFGHAIRGVRKLVVGERNARVHAALTVGVIALSALLRISLTQWCLIALACCLVWIAEAANTALERLADAVHPERHPLIGEAKDIAAGGVLIAAGIAIAIGLLVFVPELLDLIAKNESSPA
ncbi:diacylglycerol kinase family protein [Stratiformator vulcanicus]|uniref:Undecaprenol kinase n=1 Tax=Stratiformator vulcanicus TaxID=2527980 RepID=A0A517R7I4_9PLAN|nr:diacylglycerol kinase family protein [Stratiformator vulcanicus]QDT39793.1 Undecaprenol kinase [Stratiformator vulcanicus]